MKSRHITATLLFMLLTSGIFPYRAVAEEHICGAIDRDAINAQGSAYILAYMRRHAEHPDALPLARDSLARLDYAIASLRNWWSIQKELTNDQPEAFYILTRQIAVMCDSTTYVLIYAGRVTSERLGIRGNSYCNIYYMLNHREAFKWRLSWKMLVRANHFALYTKEKQTRLYGKHEDMKRYFESPRSNPCRKEIAPGYALETFRSDSSRLGGDFSLLCRMGGDIAAMAQILGTIQGQEKIADGGRQIGTIARKLLEASNNMNAHITTHSYPLAVREQDPDFEGDPFAVFQAYQRQAEEAAGIAQAALDAVGRKQGR